MHGCYGTITPELLGAVMCNSSYANELVRYYVDAMVQASDAYFQRSLDLFCDPNIRTLWMSAKVFGEVFLFFCICIELTIRSYLYEVKQYHMSCVNITSS